MHAAGRTLLNLDTEEWGEIYVGCAGGGDTTLTLPCDLEAAASSFTPMQLQVSGEAVPPVQGLPSVCCTAGHCPSMWTEAACMMAQQSSARLCCVCMLATGQGDDCRAAGSAWSRMQRRARLHT